jgi:hypothetical protein
MKTIEDEPTNVKGLLTIPILALDRASLLWLDIVSPVLSGVEHVKHVYRFLRHSINDHMSVSSLAPSDGLEENSRPTLQAPTFGIGLPKSTDFRLQELFVAVRMIGAVLARVVEPNRCDLIAGSFRKTTVKFDAFDAIRP